MGIMCPPPTPVEIGLTDLPKTGGAKGLKLWWYTFNRDKGGGGHVPPPQDLGYQLTLFGPRGADYARHFVKSEGGRH